jgi:ketosteroid isomerase-like protein
MSEENVAVVREVCAAWERGDWAASVGRYDPDLKVVYSTSAFPDAGTYRGGRVALDAWIAGSMRGRNSAWSSWI